MTAVATMQRRREFHAATAQTYDNDAAARKLLNVYHGRKNAAVIPDFKFEPGYVYTQVRAISARINQNYDGWPSSELKKAYKTFLGKPVFVNHQNEDPEKQRGKVVAARYVEAGDDKYIETVMQIDAKRFPLLAKEIKEGGLDSVSMGVEAGFTICSVCNNKAVDTPDFCDHVKFHKGQKFRTASGEETLVYEKCYKLGFFELSYVFDPADETAVVSRVISAANHQANPLPPLPDDLQERSQFQQWLGEHPQYAEWLAERGPAEREGRRVANEHPKAHYPYPEDEELFPEIHPQSFDAYDRGRPHRNADPKGVVPREAAAGGTDAVGLKPTKLKQPSTTPKNPSGGGSSAPAAPLNGPKGPKKNPAQKNKTPGVPMGTVSLASIEAAIRQAEVDSPGVVNGPNANIPWEEGTGSKAPTSWFNPTTPSAPATPSFSPGEWGSHPESTAPKLTPPAPPATKPNGNWGTGGSATSSGTGTGTTTPPKSPTGVNDLNKISSIEARINRLAFGEVEAPEDVDTLRQDPEDQDHQFKNMTDSPAELLTPDMDQAKRLDRAQEDQGLDADRRVEDIEDIGGTAMPQRGARRNFLVDPRTGRRYYAADDPSLDPSLDPSGGDPSLGGPPPGGDPSQDPSAGGDPFGGGDPSQGPPPGDPSQDPSLGGDPSGGGDPALSDDQLVQEAEDDLNQWQQQEAEGDPAGSNEGGTDDDYSDGGDPSLAGDDGSFPGDPGDDADLGGPSPSDGGDVPPWMQDGSDPDEDPTAPAGDPRQARRNGNYARSNQNKRRTTNGGPMSLASRNRIAAAQAPQRHYAGDDGHFDGGPYDENNQGVQEDVFLSQTPGEEAVAAPTPGDGTISNTENTLVARINAKQRSLQRDINAYKVLTATGEGQLDPSGPNAFAPEPHAAFPGQSELGGLGQPGRHNPGSTTASRRRHADAVEQPDTVNPALSGTDEQSLKSGDWDNIALDDVETQPKDASKKTFAAFDRWVTQTTGRPVRQHNAVFIRRCAARFCQGTNIDPNSMFPALGNALREARRNEGTNRGANMRRRADESLEVAAPQDRIDVEAPVRDTTDADAQASQFDLGDFGSNAGDNLADPELSVDSQIWAPGEGEGSKTSRRKADGMTAVRYAEAYIRAGLAPNTSSEKWKIAGLAQTMRHGTIVDRIRLLDAINTQRVANARRTAGVNRGAGSVPPGFGQRQLSAGRGFEASNDLSDDVGLWLK